MKIYALTNWRDNGDAFGLAIWLDMLSAGVIVAGDYVTDQPTSGQYVPTEPNAVVVEVGITQAAFDWLVNSPNYGVGSVLYDLPNPYSPDGKPDANEYGQRRAYCAKLGISNAQFRELFGAQGNPKRRKEGADNLIAWARTLPPQAKGQK